MRPKWSTNPSTLLLLLTLPLFSMTAALAQSGNQITPVITVSPGIFPIGQNSSIFLSVANGNASSNKNIQPGDTFVFTFDASSGTGFSLQSPVLVNSSTLTADDFGVSLSTSGQITITYKGVAKIFTPGDSFTIKVSFQRRTGQVPGLWRSHIDCRL